MLEYISFTHNLISLADHVAKPESNIFDLLPPQQKEFNNFVLDKYVVCGVDELNQKKLPTLLEIKYHSVQCNNDKLGNVAAMQSTLIDLQKYLYNARRRRFCIS